MKYFFCIEVYLLNTTNGWVTYKLYIWFMANLEFFSKNIHQKGKVRVLEAIFCGKKNGRCVSPLEVYYQFEKHCNILRYKMIGSNATKSLDRKVSFKVFKTCQRSEVSEHGKICDLDYLSFLQWKLYVSIESFVLNFINVILMHVVWVLHCHTYTNQTQLC